MIFGRAHKDKKVGAAARWFAWYPVQLYDGRWAWLQTLRRTKWWNEYNKTRVKYEEAVVE